MGRKVPFEIGDKFGRLTVIEKAESYVSPLGNKQGRWKCLCECGNISIVHTSNLSRGISTSCGCFAKENTSRVKRKHGGTIDKTEGYGAWLRMIRRCENPLCADYPEWGGRGIKVCKEWRYSFETFMNDMGERPKGYLLDRINPDGDYEPGNCRWASPSLSGFNTRKQVNNTSGRTGVAYIKSSGNWQVRVTIEYKTKSLGTFKTFEEACRVRGEWELNNFGEIKAESREAKDAI